MALGALAFTLVYGRFVLQAREGVHAARAAASRGDQLEAARAYLDALRAYVPGSPYERQALDGLHALGTTAAAAGDTDGERRAWNAVRAGLLGTRSLYVPHLARLREANDRLDQLDQTASFPPDPRWVGQRDHRLSRVPPSPASAIGATLTALAGFALWVGAIVLLIRRGIEEGPPTFARAPRPSTGTPPRVRVYVPPAFAHVLSRVVPPVMFVVGFTLFLLGLRFA
ncbi:MAG: hypothetical protein ABUL77_03675 [Bacteroidota bacterium]